MDERRIYYFSPVTIEMNDFPSKGFILDIGGGGEGVIGRLKGEAVIAIDVSRQELEEAPGGPLKIVMDARELMFLNAAFSTVTAFFSLMYMKNMEERRKVFAEVMRVLKPGGTFRVWDVDLSEPPITGKDIYVVQLCCRVGGMEIETGYGQRWPSQPYGEENYISMAKEAGFRLLNRERNEHTFSLVFQK